MQLQERFGQDLVILSSPLLDIRPTGQAINTDGVAGLIFTSANSVQFGVPGMRCYTVGDATAQAAEAMNMSAISAGSDVEGLIKRILADNEHGPLLHIRGEHSRGNVAERLTEAGCLTRDVIAYRQVALNLTTEAKTALGSKSPVIVPIFSPRTAQVFSSQWLGGGNIHAVALSPAVAEMIEHIPEDRVTIAAMPNAQAVLDVIEGLIDAARPLEG